MTTISRQSQRTHNKKIEQSFYFLFLILGIVSSKETSSTPTWTNEPTAMVEHVVDGPDGLSNFDYVYPGRVIDLGTKGALSLIYFQNCLREKIKGGKVTVRELNSEVHEPVQLSRIAVGCGSMHTLSAQEDRRTSAAMVFRGQDKVRVIKHSAPCLLTSGQAVWLSIIEMRSALEVFILRQPGISVDLGAYGVILVPGQAYQIKTNEGTMVVRVSPDARETSGSEPVVLGDQLVEKVNCGYP